MSEPMKTLVIDRTKWGRNTHDDLTFSGKLLTGNGQMCCLGFYALQCAGGTPAEIIYRGSPYSTPQLTWGDALTDKYNRNTLSCERLISYNDRPNLPNREQLITDEFAKIGVIVTFVN